MRIASFACLAVAPIISASILSMLGCSNANKETKTESQLWIRNNVKRPSNELRRNAEKGNAEDQFTLGQKYFELAESEFKSPHDNIRRQPTEEEREQKRKLRVKTYETAEEWLTKSAEQDHLQAQITLASYFLSETRRKLYTDHEQDKSMADKFKPVWKKSLGLKKEDRDAAILWSRRAAEQGHVHSMFLLGDLIGGNARINRGLKAPSASNKPEAYKWYQKAADHGHIDAIYELAFLYDTNRNEKLGYSKVAQADDIEALAWYIVAADLEKKVNRTPRTKHTFSLGSARQRLDEAQIKEAEEHANNLLAFIAKKMAGN